MATLLDIINQNSAVPTQTPQLGTTQQAQGLLRARTGKQISPSGGEPGISDIQEKSAADQTRLSLVPVQQQATIQGAQAQQASAAVEQQKQQDLAGATQQKAGLTLQGQIQTNQLLQDLEQNRAQLNTEKDKSKLEQVAFGLRMGDQQYVDTLQREGARQRLDDQHSFDQALTSSVFGDQTDLLQQALGGKSILAAGDREFNSFLSNLSVDQARQLAKIDLAHAAVMSQLQTQAEARRLEAAAEEKRQGGMFGAINQLPGAIANIAGKSGGDGGGGTMTKSSSGGSASPTTFGPLE